MMRILKSSFYCYPDVSGVSFKIKLAGCNNIRHRQTAGISIRNAAKSIGLKKPILTPDIAISDCRYWRYRGIPAYWYGPGGEDCSAANESISIEDLLNTVRVHALTALEYLQ